MKVLITSGGTTEKIDRVRKITNTGTGKLGSIIANEFSAQGGSRIEKIYYICESHAIEPHLPCAEIITVEGVEGLKEAMGNLLSAQKIDAVIHSMAISDYTVKNLTTAESLGSAIAKRLIQDYKQRYDDESALSSAITRYINENDSTIDNSNKVGSNIENLLISMKQTPKVISLIKSLQPSTILVGFKLLDGAEKEFLIDTGYKLLLKNNCDFLLANDLRDIKEDKHTGYLISPDRSYVRLDGKEAIAREIVSKVLFKYGNAGDRS